MLVLFMVRMSDMRRSWNADGAPRARPACLLLEYSSYLDVKYSHC